MPETQPLPSVWGSGWRRALFPGIWLVYLTQTAAGVARYSDGLGEIVGFALIAIFIVCYLTAVHLLSTQNWTQFFCLYAAMLVVLIAEALFARQDAFVMAVFIAVLTVGARRRWGLAVIATLVVAVIAVPALIPAWDAEPDIADGAALVLVSMAMWGYFGLLHANLALAEARSEVARLAAENERSRIARDLHDLLGHSLTTITVKAGLARRLSDVDPAGATQQISEVESLARSTLADVRAAVSGYREVSLASELASARVVLEAAGVAADLPGAVDAVDPRWAELFGWVVREGVTNAVRHARAGRLSIAFGSSWIEIEDNGRGPQRASGNGTGTGTGLRGLAERVADQGGALTAGAARRGGWALRVEMPS